VVTLKGEGSSLVLYALLECIRTRNNEEESQHVGEEERVYRMYYLTDRRQYGLKPEIAKE
jgi:hypothetical protein